MTSQHSYAIIQKSIILFCETDKDRQNNHIKFSEIRQIKGGCSYDRQESTDALEKILSFV